MKENRFSVKTEAGCKRLLAILIAIILLTSFVAQLISTNGGKIKVENITIDSRGASLAADLYYPAGTDDRDVIPGFVVAHGAGVTKGNMRGIAEELARRGFVVLSVNGYGTGLSEMPAYDESDMGVENYQTFFTPSGILDAVNFMRTLNFVDKTRIGIVGHSQGAMRTGCAAMLDCGYLSFNDIMINVLYNTFGQEFSDKEINEDADALAAARLSAEELDYYEYLKSENREAYDSTVNAVCMLGTAAANIGPMAAVDVAGHEVMRNCQVNKCVVLGNYDVFNLGYLTDPAIKESMHITGDISSDEWYILDDAAGTSKILGNVYDMSVLDSQELSNAMSERNSWVSFLNPETHSKNFFSVQTASDVVKYCEQVFQYNNGELGAADAKPVDARSIIFIWREILNGVALLAMIAMLVPIAALLYKTKFFATCVGKNAPAVIKCGSKRYWLGCGIAVVLGFAAIYYVNTIFAPGLPMLKALPLFPSWWLTPIFLIVVAVVSLIQLLIYHFIDKKNGESGIAGINIGLGVVNVLKTLLAAVILIFAGYLALVLIKYMFNQDFRFWMTAFEEMKAEYWALLWKFALTMFVQYLVIGAVMNYPAGGKLSTAKDNAVSILANSLGVWVCCLINILILKAGGAVFSNWTSSYGFLLFVPLTVYITRRMYQITRSIWLGAAVNSMLISWMMISTIGYNIYYAQSFISNFFNI